MTLLPWRVRAFLSNRLPLLYHLAINIGFNANDDTHWDRQLAETWNERVWPTKNDLIASLVAPHEVVLDIGCGTGSILRDLKSRGYQHLHGLEISNYAVQRLRSEGFTMHRGSAPRLMLGDATYDVIIVSQLLEHVIRRRRFATEVARLLRDGGKAFFFVPDDCLGPIDEPEHVIKYNQVSLRRFLARHFEVVEVKSLKDKNFAIPILFAHVRKRSAAAANVKYS